MPVTQTSNQLLDVHPPSDTKEFGCTSTFDCISVPDNYVSHIYITDPPTTSKNFNHTSMLDHVYCIINPPTIPEDFSELVQINTPGDPSHRSHYKDAGKLFSKECSRPSVRVFQAQKIKLHLKIIWMSRALALFNVLLLRMLLSFALHLLVLFRVGSNTTGKAEFHTHGDHSEAATSGKEGEGADGPIARGYWQIIKQQIRQSNYST